MRIILDTEKKTITVPWNYQKKLDYAAVGRELGRSASTVAKYVKMKGVPQNIRITVKNLTRKTEESDIT